MPFSCIDDSRIENHVNNDVCIPRISKSNWELVKHLLIINGFYPDKSVADSKNTQIPREYIYTHWVFKV